MTQIDLLPLAGLSAGEPLDAVAWDSRPLKPFNLAPGWWQATADFDSGPLLLDFWGSSTGSAAMLVLHPGRRMLFRTLGGAQEGRLGLGSKAGRLTINRLTLERVGAGALIGEFIARAGHILASGNLNRLKRALRTALSPATPVSLQLVGALPSASDRRMSTHLLTGIVLEGTDGTETLASLATQTAAPWALATDLTSPPDIWISLRVGDRLRPDALAQIAARFVDPAVHAVFTDEVFSGVPTTKPAWDAEFARHLDYVGRLTAWRAATTGGPVPIAGSQKALAALAASRGEAAIDRLALPLLDRSDGPALTLLATAPPLICSRERVSVIVPTRDRPELIGPCLEAVLEKTDHPDLEFIVVDNGTRDPAALRLIEARRSDPRVRIIRIEAPFNYSALNNAAARLATGPIIVLLNNDVLPRDSSWLSHLAARAAEPEIGAVGPLLLYPDRTVQHAGVALGIGAIAGHPWKGVAEDVVDDNPHLAFPQQRSALTAACLALRRSVFEQVGGFDEVLFPVTLNDVDLCLRVREAGLRLVMDSRIRMVHLESKSRPSDWSSSQRARVVAEQAAFRALWSQALADDPFYSPALTRADETGAVRS